MMAAYYDAAQIEESFQNFDNLRESGEPYDICLLVSNKEIWAHKEVLASGSEFFERKFNGSFYSGKPVLLKKVKYEIMREIVNFIYTRKIDITPENVCDVFKEAKFLKIKLLQKPCLDFMEDNIDVDNCVKIWSIANTYNHEKLLTAVVKYIFANLEIVSDKIEFLNLSNKEILDLFKRCPQHEIFIHSFVICANKWSAKKENWEETALKILEVIPEEKLPTNLFNYFLKPNLNDKWLKCLISAVLKPNILDTILSSYEAAEKYHVFIKKEPIVIITRPNYGIHKFHKFDCQIPEFDCESPEFDCQSPEFDCQSPKFNLWITKKFENHSADDFISYKNNIFGLGNKFSVRYTYDDHNENGYQSAFKHDHDKDFRPAILNDSMVLIGGVSSKGKGSIVDLNTNQITSFKLLHDRTNAGVAVIDGSIYTYGGSHKDIMERYDWRDKKTAKFGEKLFDVEVNNERIYVAALPNHQLFISHGTEYRIIDTRERTFMKIKPPDSRYVTTCLFSSYNKLYTVTGDGTVYEYTGAPKNCWERIVSFPDLPRVYNVISF